MVKMLSYEFRKYNRNRNQLKNIFKETHRILELLNLENFFPGENILDELLPTLTFDKISHALENLPAIVIFGQSSKSKATLVNSILSYNILPTCNGKWRWVKISGGTSNHINLTLGLEYEIVENLKANEKPWVTIPVEDLQESGNIDFNCPPVLEVKLNQQILKDSVQLFIAPDDRAVQVLAKNIFKILPIFFYALGDEPLSNENLQDLRDIKETYPYNPILFISSQYNISTDAQETEKQDIDKNGTAFEDKSVLSEVWINQISDLSLSGYNESIEVSQTSWYLDNNERNSIDLIILNENSDKMINFVHNCLQNYLVNVSNYLNEVHNISLRKFILSAFDMAREIQITPKRIQYVLQKENELYSNLTNVVSAKQEELAHLIQRIIQEMKDEVLDSPDESNRSEGFPFMDSNGREWSATVQAATSEVQKIVLNRLREKVAKQLVESVKCLQDTFLGTLQRCLISLEKTYENDINLLASNALKQILSAAYNIELHNSSPSLVHSFLERLRQLFKSIQLPWSPTPALNTSWRKKVTLDVLNSLSAAKLARMISVQCKDKIKSSHDSFQSAMKSLENHYSGKLERTEEQRIAIRKYHAPRLAKLALESTSMSDMLRYGIPQQGKEIGRGQYGVVFSCEGWGGAPGPCAIKSVIPPDERHWNDLAMEVYYTRSIPDHNRIMKLRGSVIDHNYGNGYGLGAAVLLITDRMSRDLYCGLQTGLSWQQRIQIAIDVLEGIRYLHSQGLVHRDIKLKNVLLDTENRAKLTDLGFCITEAMMSGSIVGTPVHMAPELLTGHYDSSVDIYAFGILFWYICAGHVRFPYAFEQFHNKEELWTVVKRGIRPERLISFDEECWNLMEQCWSGEPSKRPLLGAILPVLETIKKKTVQNGTSQQIDNSVAEEYKISNVKKKGYS